MRIQEKDLILLSEDLLTDPKQIRFKSETDVVDAISLTKSRTIEDTLPVGTNVISMGAITAGKFIYIKAKNNCVIDISGQTLNLLAGKASSMWVSYTAISIIVSTDPNDIVLVIAGT